jgi:hypothetical protein
MREWHRLFGLTLTAYFTDSAYRVEVEKDISLKQQLWDVVIIEQESGGPLQEPPDDLENLARHNMLKYKSLREPLNGWTLDELVGHYFEKSTYRVLRGGAFGSKTNYLRARIAPGTPPMTGASTGVFVW